MAAVNFESRYHIHRVVAVRQTISNNIYMVAHFEHNVEMNNLSNFGIYDNS